HKSRIAGFASAISLLSVVGSKLCPTLRTNSPNCKHWGENDPGQQVQWHEQNINHRPPVDPRAGMTAVRTRRMIKLKTPHACKIQVRCRMNKPSRPLHDRM